MKKIPTLFKRDPNDRRYVTPEVTEGCEWVIAGEGRATRKYDGTCVMFDGESWWARREVKPGKNPPENFVPVDHDDTTGKTVGWEPAEQSGFWPFVHEVVSNHPDLWAPGTYELCGPKINGNPERFAGHVLVPHGIIVLDLAPRDFEPLRTYLGIHTFEGIVWHHPDGRMAKLKRRDFPERPYLSE